MDISTFGDIGNRYLDKLDIINYFPKLSLAGGLEIILLTIVVYYIAKSLKETRVWVLMKGLAVVLSFYLAAYLLNFNVIVFIFKSILLFLGIAIVVIIQPDLRKLIEKIGTKNINTSISNIIHNIFKKSKSNIVEEKRISDTSINEIVKGCFLMSKVKTGVLIVIEGNIPLTDVIASGIPINADITSALLINIFEKNTPLHDGAIVISKDKIIAGTCYLPLSQSSKINKDLGTRHRAAIGISEVSDAAVVVVSEETGNVSFIKNGKINHNISREKLLECLSGIQIQNRHKADKHKSKDRNIWLKIASLAATTMMWFLITASINPIVTETFRGIPIEYLNTQLLTDTNKTFTVNSSGYVNVTVKDRKDIVDSITNDDIRVIADFSKLSYVNSIPLEVISIDYPNSDFRLSQSTINISMEDVISTEVEIELEKTGNPNDKYYISNIELSESSVIISGAKSIINTIGRAVVTLDESKLTTNTTVELDLKIYDKNGSEIDKNKLKISVDKIKANISLYKTKEVSLNITPVISEPTIEKIIDTISCDTNTILITGPDEILDKYNSIAINIPIDIKISDITQGEFIKNIILQDYLPDSQNGLMVTPQYNRVNLNIKFKDFYSKTIQFNSSTIEGLNLDKDLKATFENKEMALDLVSESINFDELDTDILKPCADLRGLTEGEYNVNVTFRGPFDVVGDTSIKVTISKIKQR